MVVEGSARHSLCLKKISENLISEGTKVLGRGIIKLTALNLSHLWGKQSIRNKSIFCQGYSRPQQCLIPTRVVFKDASNKGRGISTILHQSLPQSVAHYVNATVKIEFFHQARFVGLNRFDAD